MALAAATTAALVLTTGSVAVAANLGILGSESKEPVGKLGVDTVADLSAPVDPVVVTVDEIVPVPVTDPAPDDLQAVPAPAGSGDDQNEVERSDDVPAPAPTVAPVAPTPSPTIADHHEDDHGTTSTEPPEHEPADD